MTTIEIISLVVTIVCLLSFCLVFTFLFSHYYTSLIRDVKNGKDDIDLIDLYIEEEEEKNSKGRKASKILGKVFSYSLLLIIVGFFGISLVSRFSNDQILIGDSTLIVIASGSMSKRNEANTYLDTYNLNNQFDTYDVIGITKYNSQSEVKLFDVVAFKGDDNVTYVHRIREINENGTYITRGDSNALDDTAGGLYKNALSYDKIIGHYNETRIKSIGVFVVFLQSNSGIITVTSIIYCMLMFDHFRNKYYDALDERQEKIIKVLNYDTKNDLNPSEVVRKEAGQFLVYKNVRYSFINNEFKEKVELKEDDPDFLHEGEKYKVEEESETENEESTGIKNWFKKKSKKESSENEVEEKVDNSES